MVFRATRTPRLTVVLHHHTENPGSNAMDTSESNGASNQADPVNAIPKSQVSVLKSHTSEVFIWIDLGVLEICVDGYNVTYKSDYYHY